MKKYLLLLILAASVGIKAQTFVTIPDANFATWLQSFIPSAMNGNQLNTSSSLVTTTQTILVGSKNISDLTGIQYFTSLQHLECQNNLLTTLPPLPNTLQHLFCHWNFLSTLPTLPSNLTILNCDSNALVNLPTLPNSLTSLNCKNNPLTSLPALPNSLDSLICSYDSLTNLPALPSTLQWLECGYDNIASIPNLPSTLVGLLCQGNALTSLPTLPNSLMLFDCSDNQLGSLPNIPSSLQYLVCNFNHLSSLPSIPNGLQWLECNFNQLTTLPTLPNSIGSIYCNNNQITALPPLPSNLQLLDCSNNQISCFPPFPTTIPYGAWNISNNPFYCLPNYIPAMSQQFLAMPLCASGNITGCPSASGVLGNILLDKNGNCSADSADQGLTNIHLRLYDSNNNLIDQTFSSYNGLFNFAKPNGTYKAVIDTANLPFEFLCANSNLDTTILVAGLDSNVNFFLSCKPGFDIGVQSVSTYGWVFPGQQHVLNVSAGGMTNWHGVNCTTGIGGQVQITVNGPVSYVGPVPGCLIPIASSNVFTYSVSDFGLVNNNSDFQLLLLADTSAQVGDTICVTVVVTPTAGDNNSGNNSYEFCYLMTNSHDPNGKEVYPVGVPLGYNGWFNYTIHFQNTGTAPAFNIRIADTLDSKLDLTTFEILGYSHPNNAYLNGQLLTVYFPNINLPDSTTNAKGSMGYVQYRIKPKSNWAFGTQITNRANIFFDYNTAILTNTTVNTILSAVDVQEHSEGNVRIYPNPGSGYVNFEASNKIDHIVITDLLGKTVFETSPNELKASFDALTSGFYIAKIYIDSYSVTRRLIVR